jgi:hypothetical protein
MDVSWRYYRPFGRSRQLRCQRRAAVSLWLALPPFPDGILPETSEIH